MCRCCWDKQGGVRQNAPRFPFQTPCTQSATFGLLSALLAPAVNFELEVVGDKLKPAFEKYRQRSFRQETTTRTESKLPEEDEISKLRRENAYLKSLLSKNGIPWEMPSVSVSPPVVFSTQDKIKIFTSLFRGRVDVYPKRWESRKGTSGYSPACSNEWRTGVCEKPKVKCGDCDNRSFLPITNQVIYDHLSGRQTIGVYPLLTNDRCCFLAVDFDKGEWREDAAAFVRSCKMLNIPAALEISRSGNGAHVWIFFEDTVSAKDARQLGAAIVSFTCAEAHSLSLTSYDRFFPNQDTLPKGGFGNLIALPLQKVPREKGGSIFVDEQFTPYPDQWAFLASIQKMTGKALEDAILTASGGRHPVDVSFALEDEEKPWEGLFSEKNTDPMKISGVMPRSLKLVLSSQIFIEKENLPQALFNRLIRLAAFQNPEFYKAQAMRLPVWDKPRIISSAENYAKYIALPRGCLDDIAQLLQKNGIDMELADERIGGEKLSLDFTGNLREEQHIAVRKVLRNDIGVLCAPTAFGKTVTAAAVIAERGVSTLILVHRTELLRQWQERLTQFLDLAPDTLGTIGAGKKKPTGKIDIAVMQSLIGKTTANESERFDAATKILEHYGQIIVDECHHISAFSFESILKKTKAKFVLGLTATPVRRDGLQPIIFMQCGPIRHAAAKSETAPTQMVVCPKYRTMKPLADDVSIQEIFRTLVEDNDRNRQITEDIATAFEEGRKILVLTERTEHLVRLQEQLHEPYFFLHGRMSKKQRASVLEELNNLEPTAPRILLATGRLVGEGFDHPALDTLVLAMPISWKGTLQQYAGRLHRQHSDKTDVRIYDYVELENPQLSRMWNKRLRGYKDMGYVIKEQA